MLARHRDPAALAVALVIAYVWVAALPFQTEARYALPAKMPAIIAAIQFIDSRWRRTRVAPSD